MVTKLQQQMASGQEGTSSCGYMVSENSSETVSGFSVIELGEGTDNLVLESSIVRKLEEQVS